jgi:phenylacetate-CoA ligase
MYGALFRNALWPFWERVLHGRRTAYYLDELERTQWLPAADIRRRQDEKRQRIVQYAAAESPLYRERLQAAGVDPARCIEPDQWRRIPLLTKADLQQHRDALMADSWRGKPVIISHSGGSTGNPVEFCYNRDHYDRRIAAWYRADRWGGYELGEKHIMFWLGIGSGVGSRPWKEYLKEHLHWSMLRWYTLTVSRMGPERMREYHRRMMKIRPRSVFGIARPVTTIAQFMLKEKLPPPPNLKGVIVSSEKVFPWQKELIAEAFNAPVHERYGCQEFCNIGEECDRHDGMHINADGLYVEVTDDLGNPLPPGTPGQIVITSFDNVAMPFIRYKMGDIGTLTEDACGCGRGLPRIKEVLGREMDMIVTPEGSICAGIMIPHFMKEFRHIRGFQFVQEALDHVRLRIAPEPEFDKSILGFMEEQLRRYVGPTMKVDFEFVESLETLLSGKYKMVISKIEQRGK